MRVKICGVTHAREPAALVAAGVDLAGLWHGVHGGHADLTADRLNALAATTRAAGMTPVIVTLGMDTAAVAATTASSGIEWVQLHGYQQPATVRALKQAAAPLTVVKVLHLRGFGCVEAPLVAAYERAGVDMFLLDSVTGHGRVGSTATTLDARVAERIVEQTSVPFMLAGGLHAGNVGRFRGLVRHPRCFGIDVDTAARGVDGLLDVERIARIRRAWTAAREGTV